MIWLTFVGEGRSGHTIVSAILGSHPHGFIGEERKSISRWYRDGWSKDQIVNDVLTSGMGKERKTKGFDEKKVLSYSEPLLFMGDKCGWDATNEYTKRGAPKDIFNQFGQFMGMPVKVIVTVRNPFDNISAWCMSPKYQRLYPDENFLWKRMTRRYRRFHRAAQELIEEAGDYFVWYNEAAIQDPVGTIQTLSDWLELSADNEWVQDCSSKLFTKPNQRSNQIEWPEKYKKQTFNFIQESPLMRYYRETT